MSLASVNYLITQPIWLVVYSAQYEKFAQRVAKKEALYDRM